MTETTLCGYCEELPEKGRAAATQVNRCPLCKTELGTTNAGRRFRIGENATPTMRKHLPLLVGLAFVGAMLTSLAAWLALPPSQPEPMVVLPPPPSPIVAPATKPQAAASTRPH